MPDRLTTYEAACVLRCTRSEALEILRAAHVPCEKAGAAFLWDAKTVRRLRRALHECSPEGGSDVED